MTTTQPVIPTTSRPATGRHRGERAPRGPAGLRRLRAAWAAYRARLAAERTDRGSALILVVGTMSVLALFATVAMASSVGTLKFTDRQEDWNEALSAAEAGVGDYLARLNKDDNYWTSVDCNNVAMKRKMSSCSAWSSLGPKDIGWAPVPGSSKSFFHYDSDITNTRSTGVVVLTATGKVGTITRSVQVRLRREGFGEFLYYTMYETIDPANTVVYSDTSRAQTECARYDWENPRPTYNSSRTGCPDIVFATGDVISGPLHTNDILRVGGNPRFKGTTTTSRPSCQSTNGSTPPLSSCVAGSGSPTFDRGIAFRGAIDLPASIGNLKQYVQAGAPVRGCLYTGPTRIRFLAPSGSATPMMRVWSKGSTSNTGLTTACGGSDLTKLKDGNSVDVAVPQNTVIYVQDVPSGQTVPTCTTAGSVGDSLPVANDVNLGDWDAKCQYGTLYLEGTLKGRVTVSTDNNVIVTGDLLYSGGQNGNDALGLVANNSVKVYHPVRCTTRNNDNVCTAGTDLSGVKQDITIQAAILTLQHSFIVQAYTLGSTLNYLNIYGAISQRFRGPVGQTQTQSDGTKTRSGYLKGYVYDTRLRYAPPPYFLDPVKSSWGQKTFGEVAPQYR